MGGAGDPRSDRGVGLRRPLASQARAPRLLHRQGVRVSLDAVAGRAQASSRAAGRAGPPTPAMPAFPEVPWEKNRIWIWDAERHEALWNRAVMKGHRLRLVAASRVKLGAAYPVETDGHGWQAAPTTTERASTVRWSGSGKRDGKVYERNQRLNASQERPPARTWQIWAGQQRASAPRRGELLGRLMSPAGRPR